MAHHFRIKSLITTIGLLLSLQTLSAYSNPTTETPEKTLESVVADIRAQNVTQALQTLDQLIKRYPDFQLAQMIRADLLYARGSVLEKMGQSANKETVDNLKSEIEARLSASKAPPQGLLPANLLTLPSWLSHLITVDLKSSRVYLFNVQQGQLKFVTSYYMTQGKLGAGKEKEGDKRTPIGAYFLESHIDSSRISSFYGIGAAPLSYPNSWDRRNNRTGHGIWIHGTPIGQYSRPPKASDGCVVLTNDDLKHILELDWRKTLVIIDKELQWVSPTDYQQQQQQALSLLDNWRVAWEKQELNKYLAFYANDFVGGAQEGIKEWTARKTQIFSYKRTHTIELNDLLVVPYPNDKNLMVTIFNQKYTRDGVTSLERKRLWWRKNTQGQWQIFNEEVLSKLAF